MEIREITFEEILPYWKILWKEYVDRGYGINKVNLDTQKDWTHLAYYHISHEWVEKLIKPVYAACFIDEKIVGVESGYKTNIDYYRIRGLWVDENYRRRGVATKLVRYFEGLSKEYYIWTIPRATAIKFYLSCGFNIDGKLDTIYGTNYFAIKKNENYKPTYI
jgi:ribosomal protein S18 acetylase RimI-like enzyme